MNTFSTNNPDFHIEVTEVEKTEKFQNGTGVLGETSNMITGYSDFSDVIYYLFFNMDRYIEKENINLKYNPFLKVLLVTRKRCSLKDKSEKLFEFLNEKYDLNLDSTYIHSDFIVIKSLDKFEKPDSNLRESSVKDSDSLMIFNNIHISEIIKIIKFNNKLKLELETENSLEFEDQRFNFQIPKIALESQEAFSSKLKELGVEFEIIERGYWQYQVSD